MRVIVVLSRNNEETERPLKTIQKERYEKHELNLLREQSQQWLNKELLEEEEKPVSNPMTRKHIIRNQQVTIEDHS